MQFSWFSGHEQLHVFMEGSCGVGCSVSYDIQQTIRAFDTLRGLTVGVKLAAHVAVWESSDIGIYN